MRGCESPAKGPAHSAEIANWTDVEQGRSVEPNPISTTGYTPVSRKGQARSGLKKLHLALLGWP
jgi:hypothetical protein